MSSLLNWKERSFGEVATLQRGFDLPVQDRREGHIPIFAANGPVGFHDVAKVKGPGVITGRSGTLGKVHLAESDYWPLNTALWVKDFRGNEPRWICRLLRWMNLEQFTRGVGVPTLNRNLVHEVRVRVPPLAEQKRIAGILDAADALRAKRREALAQPDSRLQATFLDLFGDPTDGSKYPAEPLGNHIKFMTTGGRGWAEYYREQGARFIRSLDVQMNSISNEEVIFVDPPKNAEAKRTRVEKGDVLLTMTGSRIGRASSVPDLLDGSYISQHVAILRFAKPLESEYVARYLSNERYGQMEIRKWQYGQTKPGLNFEQVKSFLIPIPPVEQQRNFIAAVRSVERQTTAQRAHLAELDTLFASLQSRAFRGEL